MLGKNLTLAASGNVSGATDIAMVSNNSPYITVYPWESGTGFGTKYSNPATLPPNEGVGVAFSPDGSNLAVAHRDSPAVTVYPWSSSGFGTKYGNPSSVPGGQGNSVAFSPDGNAIAVAHSTGDYISAYP